MHIITWLKMLCLLFEGWQGYCVILEMMGRLYLKCNGEKKWERFEDFSLFSM